MLFLHYIWPHTSPDFTFSVVMLLKLHILHIFVHPTESSIGHVPFQCSKMLYLVKA